MKKSNTGLKVKLHLVKSELLVLIRNPLQVYYSQSYQTYCLLKKNLMESVPFTFKCKMHKIDVNYLLKVIDFFCQILNKNVFILLLSVYMHKPENLSLQKTRANKMLIQVIFISLDSLVAHFFFSLNSMHFLSSTASSAPVVFFFK